MGLCIMLLCPRCKRYVKYYDCTPCSYSETDLTHCGKASSGFSLTPYLESFTPILGLGTPVFG